LDEEEYDIEIIEAKMKTLRTLGVPYTEAEIADARDHMATQAAAIAADIVEGRGPAGLEKKKITALTAYLQRLGTDIKWREPEPAVATAGGN
jgi:cytochrome c oxidase cbb3-type subunit I/II